jgi:two-component system, OmpR family, response regulator
MSQVQHIVVVDDEQPAREMVGDYLRMHGFGVSLCDGGAALRKVIAQQVPDLIVLDLNMPEEDGLSIIRDLKQRINVPIIMLTATASAIDRVVGLELGADDYLAKPCELRELLARIRSVLRRSGAGQQPAAQPAPVTPPPASDRAIDLRIMRIRRKIEPDPAHPSVIRTVRGGGYLFSPGGDTSSVD